MYHHIIISLISPADPDPDSLIPGSLVILPPPVQLKGAGLEQRTQQQYQLDH